MQQHAERILADTCFGGDSSDECDWTQTAFEPARPGGTGLDGEAILVVDSFPSLTTNMFRYRSRIAGYLRPTRDGTVAAVEASFRLPTRLHETFVALPGEYPLDRLAPIAEAAHATYAAAVQPEAGHGPVVFGALVAATPAAPLVLLDGLGFETFAPDLFCASGDDDAATQALAERSAAIAESLQAWMTQLSVRYVSYSGGWTLPVARETWQASCSGPLPNDEVLGARLATFGAIHDVLFGSQGVVAAQAANQGTTTVEFPFDGLVASYRNRVRVGFFSVLDSMLDAQGRGGVRPLGEWPSDGWADLWLNSGVLPMRPFPYGETPHLLLDVFGTSLEPVGRATSSWLTPLATSWLVYLRNERFPQRPFDDALVQELLDALTPAGCVDAADGRCRFQDPLRHGQLEAVRQGVRPLKFQE